MVRLQIQLEPSVHRDVKRRARRLGVSVSEIVRRSVAAELGRDDEGPEERGRRALAAVGRHADPKGRGDVARGHDAELAEAFRR
jgi:post-segregation antitoxin (ccd killing protein)